MTNYDGNESYDGAGKRPLTDVIKIESGESIAEVQRPGEKKRRYSNSSIRDGSAPSVAEGTEQGNSYLTIR